jgi:CMP-N-acetylneuraminic acid synthetase
VHRAAIVAADAGAWPIVSADIDELPSGIQAELIRRPAALAQDDTPMIAVVQHVLEQMPGPPDQKIVLLQPTQPLREPKHLTQALALLTPDVDSVVSVTPLPLTHNPEWQYVIHGDQLAPWPDLDGERASTVRRQDLTQTYIRDGTVYVFWRKTVIEHGDIYGHRVRPLIVPQAETCSLDTPKDWIEAERRLKEREGGAHRRSTYNIVKCPGCGLRLESRECTRKHRLRAQGRCTRCASKKLAADERHWECRPCRLRRAAARRRQYRRHNPNAIRETVSTSKN